MIKNINRLGNAIIEKSKENKLSTIVFILRLSPMLPYQWVSVIYGNILKDSMTNKLLFEYLLSSVFGVFIPLIPYIMIGYIAHRTILNKSKINQYFNNNYNNNYITNLIEVIGSKLFPKNKSEFIEFFVNILIVIIFWGTSKVIGEYIKKNINLDTDKTNIDKQINNFLVENNCECGVK